MGSIVAVLFYSEEDGNDEVRARVEGSESAEQDGEEDVEGD